MSHPITLPLLGASLFLSVAAGIHLGESTIGLINPLYFEGPAPHPRDRGAAIDESRLPIRGPAYADLYGWEEGNARAADCIDCDALAARDAYAYSAVVPYFGPTAEPRREADGPYAKVVVPPPEEPVVETEGMILRYAYYPVEAKVPVEVGTGVGGPEADETALVEYDQE